MRIGDSVYQRKKFLEVASNKSPKVYTDRRRTSNLYIQLFKVEVWGRAQFDDSGSYRTRFKVESEDTFYYKSQETHSSKTGLDVLDPSGDSVEVDRFFL